MKKSELRNLIREMIKEDLGPYRPNKRPRKPKPPVSPVDANVIGPATPIIGYNCNENGGCEVLYDIPINANMQAEFSSHSDCVASGCAWYSTGENGPYWPPN